MHRPMQGCEEIEVDELVSVHKCPVSAILCNGDVRDRVQKSLSAFVLPGNKPLRLILRDFEQGRHRRACSTLDRPGLERGYAGLSRASSTRLCATINDQT